MIGDSIDSIIKLLKGLAILVIVLSCLLIYTLWPASEKIIPDKEDINNWYPISRDTGEILMGQDTYEILTRRYMRKIKICKHCYQVIENK